MALAETPDRGIARHRSNCREAMSNQGRSYTHASSRARGFAAGMAAADHNYVEGIFRDIMERTSIAKASNPEAVSSTERYRFT